MKDRIERKKAKEWLVVIIPICISVLFVSFMVYKIISQTGESMQEETAGHLKKIVEQTKVRVDVRTKLSWDMIQNIEEILRITEGGDQNSISGYMEYEKSVWGFKKVFLLTEEMSYYDESENLEPFELERDLYERMYRGEHLNTIKKNENGEGIIYYLRATDPIEYKNTHIIGIGISFKVEELLKEIEVSVLENKGDCYILDTKGDCLIYINDKEVEQTDNVVERIKELIGGTDKGQLHKLESMIYDRKSGSLVVEGKKERYYVTCMPMAENDWVYLTVIPEKKLCDNMEAYTQKVTAYALIIIAVVVVICLIVIWLLYNKKLEQAEETVKREYLESTLEAEKRSAKAKGQFLISMSHDIRTPMNGIMGMSMIAKANINNKEKVEYCLNKIDASANHLVQLINDILDISKLESEKFHLNNEKFNLHTMLEEVVDLVHIQADAKSQNFRQEFDRRMEMEVWADVVSVKKILLNLLSNAVKYTTEGGEIVFKAKIEETFKDTLMVKFEIKDNGKGMEESYIKSNIYRAFEREEKDDVKTIEGSGLGLAITKQLVDAMEGSIDVESKVGQGSTFYVELPMKKEDVELVNVQESTETEEFSYQNKRFLLVEDNELNTEIMKEILTMAGAVVETAGDGKQAVEIFEQSPEDHFDYILMDIQMPVMDGYTAVKEIRKLNRGDANWIIIIAMTAHAFLEDIEKTKAAGMNGHVAKPIDMKVLSEKLAACEKQRLNL